MAQVSNVELLKKIIAAEVLPAAAIAAFFDRQEEHFLADEGQLLDYKQSVAVNDESSVAELGRDILGFSNTDGGVLIVGVADDRTIVSHEIIDFRRLRDSLGPYIGTRVDFELEEIPMSVCGKPVRLIAVIVKRSMTAYPNHLRRDIELRRPGLARKVKYLKGTLFYRRDDRTLAESPSADIESRIEGIRFFWSGTTY